MFPTACLGCVGGSVREPMPVAEAAEEALDKVALEPMTCRIDRVVNRENLVVVCISGQIIGEHVDTLRTFLESEEKVAAIDLKEVLLVDREAVKVLAASERDGIELRNCPAYVREWVTRARAEMGAGRSE